MVSYSCIAFISNLNAVWMETVHHKWTRSIYSVLPEKQNFNFLRKKGGLFFKICKLVLYFICRCCLKKLEYSIDMNVRVYVGMKTLFKDYIVMSKKFCNEQASACHSLFMRLFLITAVRNWHHKVSKVFWTQNILLWSKTRLVKAFYW